MAIQLVHFSSCGPVRATNQDAYCVRISSSPFGLIVMALVCDGMGGMSCGEIASATVATAFGKWFDARIQDHVRSGLTTEGIAADWNNIVRQKHNAIRSFADRNGLRIGTTLSVILVAAGKYFLMHVGDCRVYLEDGNLLQLTKDQTLAMREYEAGRISREEYQTDSRHNVLLQCVGNSSVNPVFLTGEAPQTGGILLCSDGFYHTVDPLELHQAMEMPGGKKEFQHGLLKLANRGRLLGESDNMTCVAVRWKAGSPVTYTGDTLCGDELDSLAKINFVNADVL